MSGWEGIRRRALRLFFIVLCAAPFCPRAASGADPLVRIEIPAVVQADDSAFALGDIAWITGPDAVREALRSLVLSVEEEGVVTREQVIRAVEASGLEGIRLEIRMSDRVRVEAAGGASRKGRKKQEERKGREGQFSPDASLASVIKSLAAWDGGVEVSHSGEIPRGRLVSPASMVPGTLAATLRFRDESGRERSLPVRMVWTQNVLIMAQSIPKGQPLSAADFVTRSLRVTKPGLYATQLSEVVGRISRKPLMQGKPVPLELLSARAAAEKGRTVVILVRYKGLAATVKGVLLDEGDVGSIVRVRRVDNKKVVLRGRVLDSDTVEVDVP